MKFVILLFCIGLLCSCEPGLAPPDNEVEPGFGGTVYFAKGTWPPQDSLYNLWIVASKIYPLDSTKVFEGLSSDPPSIYVYPSFTENLPYNVDSVVYSFKLPPATYKYVGVLQRFREEISVRSLRVVGLYGTTSNPPQPVQVVVGGGQFVLGVNIQVNFHNPPPQPF